MKTIEIKILENEAGHGTLARVIDAFHEALEKGNLAPIEYHPQIHPDDIKAKLKDIFCGDVEIQNQVYHGCYGASSGKQLKGFKVYLDSSLFPTRFIDSEGDEIVNIEQLCNQYGELAADIDVDQFETIVDQTKVFHYKADNTYNYLGQDSYSPHALQHADFSVYSATKNFYGEIFVVIKFHCGGDVRGNYSSKVLYRFGSMYEVYCALYPALELKELG